MRFGLSMQQNTQFDSLEACVQSARQALACPFSSSDEYEAALIAERRAAGAYGHSRHYQRIAGCMLVLAIAAAAFVIL